MNPDDLTITMNSQDSVYYSSTTIDDCVTIEDTTFDITNIGSFPIHLDEEAPTELEIKQRNGETLKVAATIRQQKYEIEALTDIIKEMVKTKNFDVELDIEKRVEQKKFLTKLGED